jgi:hypothetical protein
VLPRSLGWDALMLTSATQGLREHASSSTNSRPSRPHYNNTKRKLVAEMNPHKRNRQGDVYAKNGCDRRRIETLVSSGR